jgi:type II secretory pathway component GspD/PulD (secretin)
MPFVRKLVQEFDSDVKFGEPSVYPLKFVFAGDVLDAVVKAVTDPGAKADGANTGAPGAQTGQRGRSGGGTGGLDGGQGAFGDRSGGDRFSGGNGGGVSLSSSLQTPERSTVPDTVIVGNTKIIADPRANSIIVLGNQEVKTKIFRTLSLLDRRQPQLTLHAVIGELTLNRNEEFGVDYILRNGGRTAGGAITTPGTPGTPTTPGDGTGTGTAAGRNISFEGNSPQLNLNNLLNQRNITRVVAAGASGLNGFITAGNSLTAVVNALESTDRFRVTSRPKVSTSNNKKAIISSGQEIAVPANIQSGFNNGNNIVTNSSIQYKNVLLKLEINPLINSDREVTLDIVVNVDEVSGATTIDNNRIPTISTRALQTHVSVPNEGTLVIGGLIRQSQSRGSAGVPFLSRIPVLGTLFKNTTKDQSRTELVILIRPEVTIGPEEAMAVREREQEFLNMESDIEASLMPQGVRKRVPAAPILRESSVTIREEQMLPLLKK